MSNATPRVRSKVSPACHDMSRLQEMTRRQARAAKRKIDEASTDEEAYVRTFLASVALLSGTLWSAEVYRGRAIIEWYADCLSMPRDERSPPPPLSMEEAADVLAFVSSVISVSSKHCFGHSGADATCGFFQVMEWISKELRRHAGAEGGPAPA